VFESLCAQPIARARQDPWVLNWNRF